MTKLHSRSSLDESFKGLPSLYPALACLAKLDYFLLLGKVHPFPLDVISLWKELKKTGLISFLLCFAPCGLGKLENYTEC